MKKTPFAVAALAIGAAFFQPDLPAQAQTAAWPVDAATSHAARGKYLVMTSGCIDCQMPLKIGASGPEPDMSRLLSGHP